MEEITYTYILIKTEGTYLGWSKAKKVDKAGNGMKWIKWNKPLPKMIDPESGLEIQYKYENGELTRSNP